MLNAASETLPRQLHLVLKARGVRFNTLQFMRVKLVNVDLCAPGAPIHLGPAQNSSLCRESAPNSTDLCCSAVAHTDLEINKVASVIGTLAKCGNRYFPNLAIG
jgi:hypothetical protein